MKRIAVFVLMFCNVTQIQCQVITDATDESAQEPNFSSMEEAVEVAASQGLELDTYQLDDDAQANSVCLSAFCTPIQTCWWSYDDTDPAQVDDHIVGIRVACDYSIPYGDSVCVRGCGRGSFCNIDVDHIYLHLIDAIGQCLNQYCPFTDPCNTSVQQANVGTCVVWRMTGWVTTCMGPSGPPDGGGGGEP